MTEAKVYRAQEDIRLRLGLGWDISSWNSRSGWKRSAPRSLSLPAGIGPNQGRQRHLRSNTSWTLSWNSCLENELIFKGALTPAHEVTEQVDRKWNATKLKPFERRGQVVKDAIAAARIPEQSEQW